MLQNNDIIGTCLLNMPETLHSVDIRRQEPSQGTRLLGVQAAVNGYFSDEYEHTVYLTNAKYWQGD